MDQQIANFKAYFEGPIDFPAQRKTETLMTYTLVLGAVLTCVLGFSTQSLKTLLVTFTGSILVTLGLVVPPWPQYNTAPKIEWFEPSVVQ